jgi:FMN phosphatase YigB (HAD superfamily)
MSTGFESAHDVLAAHADAKVLTIDFFDTLVTRSVAQPTHVFAVMEEQLVATRGDEWRGFGVFRVRAEQAAREKAALVDAVRDVTLPEIVAELAAAMGLSADAARFLAQYECETEVSLARPVQFGVAITEAARARGMRVLIVSDNYMSSEHLVNMAHAAGYAWVQNSDVIVSCEHGGQKFNGKLWKAVIEHAGVSAQHIVHVGDDLHSDYVAPLAHGITAHVNDHMRRSHRDMGNTSPAVLPLSRIEANVRDVAQGDAWNVAEVLGAGFGALLVASQIVDVRNVLGMRDVAGVHFAARDGYLAHKVWNMLRERGVQLPEASYTAFSRSVVWRSTLISLDAESVNRFIGENELLTVERLERRVGCALVSQHDRSVELSASDARSVLVANAEAIVGACATLRQRLVAYLERQGMTRPGHHLVIDLGWTASTVADLAELVSTHTNGAAAIEARLTGVYWDASPNRHRLAMRGFAMDEFHSVDDNLRMLGGVKLFEALITAPHGSVVDFDDNNNPVFVETEPEIAAYSSVMGIIAEAAVAGALAILEGTHPSGVTAQDVTGPAIWAAMMQVAHTPRPDEVALLSQVRHVTAIDHEGSGTLLVAEAPASPRALPASRLPDVYDSLIRNHWLQGSLRQWGTQGDTRWIADEIHRIFAYMHPQWVQPPLR